MNRYNIGDKLKTNRGEIEIIQVGNPGYYIYQLNNKLQLLIRPFEEGYIEIIW